jgi:hypothetical protein
VVGEDVGGTGGASSMMGRPLNQITSCFIAGMVAVKPRLVRSCAASVRRVNTFARQVHERRSAVRPRARAAADFACGRYL